MPPRPDHPLESVGQHIGQSMEGRSKGLLRIGDWCVDPASGDLSRDGVTTRLEARTLRLLLFMADRVGEVVGIDDLLQHVWAGVTVTSDSVYQAVASLRRTLGDDTRQPRYIETVPRFGYRMIARVSPWTDDTAPIIAPTNAATPARRRVRQPIVWGAAAMLAATTFAWLQFRDAPARAPAPATGAVGAPTAPERSVAILPFLDLTTAMDEEPFADGVTEELINRISRMPGFRVPTLRSSFYFKGKTLPLPAIAESLHVAYLVDGSVRKSGNNLRIAARLVRADNGYVVWSESYDRPATDILMVQDEIADAVSKAMMASIGP